MRDGEKQQVWRDAIAWQEANHFVEEFDKSDKSDVLLALFRKAANMADAETDTRKSRELRAYSEGFRHALNVLEYRGKAIEAYRGVINPSIKVDVTDEELVILAAEGH